MNRYSVFWMSKRIVVIMSISFFVLMLCIWTGCSKESASQKSPPEKESITLTAEETKSVQPEPVNWGDAPDFTLPKLGGGSLTLSSLHGKVIILNFWASWCKPCREEIPYLVALQKEYQDKGLVIVGVSLDKGKEEAVTPVAEEFGINYPIVFGDHKIEKQYGGIIGYPTSIIIDRNGNIAERITGEFTKEIFEEKVKPLLEPKKEPEK